MPSTYNLARMNMFLHGILPENQHLRNGDTLDADWPTDEVTEFDAVTMNPPYSAKWSAAEGFKTGKSSRMLLRSGLTQFRNTGSSAIPPIAVMWAFIRIPFALSHCRHSPPATHSGAVKRPEKCPPPATS